jgi:hypothetical protein
VGPTLRSGAEIVSFSRAAASILAGKQGTQWLQSAQNLHTCMRNRFLQVVAGMENILYLVGQLYEDAQSAAPRGTAVVAQPTPRRAALMARLFPQVVLKQRADR